MRATAEMCLKTLRLLFATRFGIPCMTSKLKLQLDYAGSDSEHSCKLTVCPSSRRILSAFRDFAA